MTHQIYFELDRDCSMNVLYRIIEEFELPELDGGVTTGFILCLDQEDAEYFHEQYGNYIVMIQDLDQEDGGSYI